jgi:hypothetical protein
MADIVPLAPPVIPPPVPPKRGGIHPTYGKFIGGAKLNDAYEIVSEENSLYRFSTQRRHEKTIMSIERALRESRDTTSAIKFNGTLEPTAGVANEIGKERFVTLLKKRVKEHGQQTFYWIRDTDGRVIDLFEHAHRFKVEGVIAEHTRRIAVNTNYESYDAIERDEVELSRTVVESLLSETFQEKIEIRFGHRDDFETLPGSCLFMMALETCNASVFHDIEGAKKKLEALELATYPGENVTDFTSDAQRLIKIMQGAYALPVNTGSNLINKLTTTSSEFFNRKMWALLDTVMTLEMEYELTDPRLFVEDRMYSKLGPLGIVATMQATHGMLLSQHRWPALTSSLPQSNNTSVTTSTNSGALNGRKCYRCQGDHLVRDCPQPAPEGTTTGGTAAGSSGSATRVRSPLAAWKYLKPNDLTVPRVDAQGKTWKFCTKCKCRATNTVGIYQLSHYDSEHVDNYRRPAPAATGTPAAPTASTTAPPEVPTAPQSNLTSVANPNPIPPGPPDVTFREPSDAHELDEIEFTGMWCAPVSAPYSASATVVSVPPPRARSKSVKFSLGMWCAQVDLAVSADATVTHVPAPSFYSLTSVIERDNVPFVVDDDDDDEDDASVDHDDAITVVTMFPDYGSNREEDYPTTDDDVSDDNTTSGTDSDEDTATALPATVSEGNLFSSLPTSMAHDSGHVYMDSGEDGEDAHILPEILLLRICLYLLHPGGPTCG